jgi:hypothetical protein
MGVLPSRSWVGAQYWSLPIFMQAERDYAKIKIKTTDAAVIIGHMRPCCTINSRRLSRPACREAGYGTS